MRLLAFAFTIVFVWTGPGSIFKVAENINNSDAFSRFLSSAFIQRHNGGRT